MSGQRLIEVTMTDFMNVVIAHGEFKEGLNIVGGNNGDGKTSFIRALIAPFVGKSALPELPLRQGAKTYKIKIKLTDYNIELTGDNTTQKLKVSRADGIAIDGTPLQFLKELINNNPFFVDLDMFFNLQPKDVVPFLKKIFNVNTDELDKEIKGIEQLRYDDKKEKYRLDGVIDGIQLSEKPVNYIDFKSTSDELSDLETTLQELEKRNDNYVFKSGTNEYLYADIEDWKTDIKDLEAKIEKLNNSITQAREKIQLNVNELASFNLESNQTAIKEVKTLIDLKKNEIKGADNNNELYRKQESRQYAVKQSQDITTKLEQYEEYLRDVKNQRAAKIKEQGLNIEGLNFTDNGLHYKGLPIEQLSSAELDILFIRIASRLFKGDGGRFLMVKNGSNFDMKRLASLNTVCTEENIQLVVEHPNVSNEASTFYFTEGKAIK